MPFSSSQKTVTELGQSLIVREFVVQTEGVGKRPDSGGLARPPTSNEAVQVVTEMNPLVVEETACQRDSTHTRDGARYRRRCSDARGRIDESYPKGVKTELSQLHASPWLLRVLTLEGLNRMRIRPLQMR